MLGECRKINNLNNIKNSKICNVGDRWKLRGEIDGV
jgi:hypothetical protein